MSGLVLLLNFVDPKNVGGFFLGGGGFLLGGFGFKLVLLAKIDR